MDEILGEAREREDEIEFKTVDLVPDGIVLIDRWIDRRRWWNPRARGE